MMNKYRLIAGMALAVLTGYASAQATCSCTGADQVTTVSTTLSGNTVCVANGSGGWEGQEQHKTDGQLWDYKLGPGHAIDPSEQIGTWTVSGNNVTHSYSGGQSYTYTMCRVGATASYGFCGTGGTIMASIKPGTSAGCP